MISYGRQSIDESDIAAVTAVLRGQALTCGPAVDAFEAEVSRISGAPFAIAVSNGTSALRLLYQAVGIGPGVRVGVPAITFAATASQAMLLGADVVLLDVDPVTLLLTPEILASTRERLDWVVPVHAAGRQCDLAGLSAVAAPRGVRMLEDAAHAFGSTWADGRPAGASAESEGAIFSFHPVKNITTAEGGAIVVRDAAVDRRLRSLRHHGIIREGFTGVLAAEDAGAPWYHEFHHPATNERLSDLHCALGISQCQRLPAFKAARQAVHDRYRAAAGSWPWLTLPPPCPDQRPFWHLCPARIDWHMLGADRRAVFADALAHGIQLQVHYIPLHCQPAFSGLVRGSALNGAEAAYRGLVSLPCHPELLGAPQTQVIAWLDGLAQRMRK